MQEQAIVLAWDYKTIEVGCDLLCREVSLSILNSYTFDDILIIGRKAEYRGLGVLIVLDTPSSESLATESRSPHVIKI